MVRQANTCFEDPEALNRGIRQGENRAIQCLFTQCFQSATQWLGNDLDSAKELFQLALIGLYNTMLKHGEGFHIQNHCGYLRTSVRRLFLQNAATTTSPNPGTTTQTQSKKTTPGLSN